MPPVLQYDRGTRLRLTPPVDLAGPPQPPIVLNLLVPVPGLPAPPQASITFSVSKTLTPQPNGAQIRVANLTSTTRDRISGIVRRVVDWRSPAPVLNVDGVLRPGGNVFTSTLAGLCAVELEAGYGGALGQLFSGTVTRCRTVRSGADRVTELTCTDGIGASVAVANRSFTPGTPALAVVQYLAEVLGLGLAPTQGLAAFSGFVLHGGLHAHGDPLVGLTDVLGVVQLGWWIEDGQLWVLGDGETLPGQPVVVSAEPIPGAVRLRQEPDVLDQGALRIRATLAPEIRLGHAVVVAGSDLRGTYRVEALVHSGNNRGGDFTTEAVLRSPVAALGV